MAVSVHTIWAILEFEIEVIWNKEKKLVDFCTIVGTKRPFTIYHDEKKTHDLSTRRHPAWLSRISNACVYTLVVYDAYGYITKPSRYLLIVRIMTLRPILGTLDLRQECVLEGQRLQFRLAVWWYVFSLICGFSPDGQHKAGSTQLSSNVFVCCIFTDSLHWN